MDVTEQIRPFSNTPQVFHRVNMGRIAVAIYLNVQVKTAPVLLEHIPEFHHNTLEVYNLRDPDEAHLGFLFRSPLRAKIDPYFVMFIRRGLDPVSDVIKHPTSVEKRYVLQEELVFHTHDSGFLITRVEENGVTRMLNQ